MIPHHIDCEIKTGGGREGKEAMMVMGGKVNGEEEEWNLGPQSVIWKYLKLWVGD